MTTNRRTAALENGVLCVPGGGAGAPLTVSERQQARSAFTRFGFFQIETAFAPAFLEQLRAAFVVTYGPSVAGRADTIVVGDRRFMTSLELDGPFNDPALYANATMLSIVNDALGGDATLASVACVTALDGAAAQEVHADHPSLFPETALSSLLPSYAVTVIVPLVPLRAGDGATAVWLGSHLQTGPDRMAQRDEDAFIPETALGTAYLMDYRLVHHGMPNTTGTLRPVLSIVYARPWFVDAVNFTHVPPLRMPRAARAAVPPEWESLFLHVPRHGV